MKDQTQKPPSPNMRKTHRFMERTWLIIGIISLVTWFYVVVRDGFSEGTMILIITGISFLMFFVRRHLRRNRQDDQTE